MNKKTFFLFILVSLACIPAAVHAQTVTISSEQVVDFVAEIVAIVCGLVAAIYMTTLASTFRGGLFEKIWKRLASIAILFALLTIALMLESHGFLPNPFDQSIEVLEILITVMLVSLSRKALNGIMKQ